MQVLVTDDNEPTLRMHELNIERLGHNVICAQNGKEAWEKLAKDDIDIVVSDWLMPEINGIELCQKIRETDFKRYIYFIIVSAIEDQQKIIDALNAGVDDYITKPVNYDELRARIEIGARIVLLEEEIKSKCDSITRNYFQTIRTFVNLLEVFDKNLGGHCRRVGKISLKLAKMHSSIAKDDYQLIEAAGLLHDIGMIGLPNEILSKKRTELNSEEKEQYFSHPVNGEIILNEIEFLRPVAKLVRLHHEQFNGRGFPDGLSEEDIPLHAQIVSAASIYDNLIHKGKMSLEEIPERLHTFRGYQLEPSVTDLLFEINSENIREENVKKYIEISIENLEQGTILAKDVRMKTGAIVLPVSTKLTTNDIKKLQKYRRMGHFDQNVYIEKR